MLKKLVKYGNSNALVLDKALLELLDIEEGSIVKLKTDGTSLIITPQAKKPSDTVHETFTHDQAEEEARMKENFRKRYTGKPEERDKLEKEYCVLGLRYFTLIRELNKIPAYKKEFMVLTTKLLPNGSASLESTQEYEKACKTLQQKFSPELVKIQEKLDAFKTESLLAQEKVLTDNDYAELTEEFKAHFKEHMGACQASAQILDNPEFQHKAQLLAEQYKDNKSSQEYLTALNELRYFYHPELREADESMANIMKKLSQQNK